MDEPIESIERVIPFEAGNIAPFQPAMAGKIRLAPFSSETAADDDGGECLPELFVIVQAVILKREVPSVAVTTGPDLGGNGSNFQQQKNRCPADRESA